MYKIKKYISINMIYLKTVELFPHNFFSTAYSVGGSVKPPVPLHETASLIFVILSYFIKKKNSMVPNTLSS